jgi:hypothetical protein
MISHNSEFTGCCRWRNVVLALVALLGIILQAR